MGANHGGQSEKYTTYRTGHSMAKINQGGKPEIYTRVKIISGDT